MLPRTPANREGQQTGEGGPQKRVLDSYSFFPACSGSAEPPGAGAGGGFRSWVWLFLGLGESCSIAILLYSSECWCLRESEVQELRSSHHNCVCTMCRISMWHVERYSITNRELLGRLGLQTMDTHLARRQLQWLGHVWRMDWSRLPRKLLTAWVPVEEKRVGGRELTWGEGVDWSLVVGGSSGQASTGVGFEW